MLLQCHYPLVSWNMFSSIDTATHQRLPYTPHRTLPKLPKISVPSPSPITITTSKSDLCQENVMETTCIGYETWLPTPPKVDNPRSIYNAASLAFIGDCIYELYARRHFLFSPLNIEEYNDRVMAFVRCEAQNAMLRKLIDDKVLSKEEMLVCILLSLKSLTGILCAGEKLLARQPKTRTKKRAGVAVYNRASSFETLIGYLYLTNTKLLEEVMLN